MELAGEFVAGVVAVAAVVAAEERKPCCFGEWRRDQD